MEEKIYVAAQMALVAVTANNGLINHPKDLAKKAVELTDALISEMEEPGTEIEKG